MAIYKYAAVFLAASVAAPWLLGWGGGLQAWLPTSAVWFVISVGLFLRQRWAESAIFGAMIYVVASWAATIAAGCIRCWPYSGFFVSVVALVPGLLLCGFWLLMWLLTRRYFRHRNQPKGV
ncbi:MAG: hypothetical protein JO001_01470 [Alphaproteobacteria bacterium]|nr:hypothetical protein [Alphaproteobacteria bacterium]